jgi:uncharacterized membrane protein
MAGAGVLLALLWPYLPPRWVIHWGLHGRPDGWTTKTFTGAFFPIGFGLFLCGVIEGITLLILAYPRMGKTQGVAPEAARAMAIMTADFTRLVSLSVALVFALLALVLPLWQPERSGLLVLLILGLVFGSIALGMWWLWRGTQALRAHGMFADLEGWNGLFYRNARDPRVWVPKLVGIGYTLNFAHRKAWLWLAAFLGLPLLVIIVVLIQALR